MITGISISTDSVPGLWTDGAFVACEIDAAIYPIPAALAAGYKYTDRVFVWIQSSAKSHCYVVFLRPRISGLDLGDLAGSYMNELLDQTLRHRLEGTFAPLRTLITAQAFSEGNLLDVVADPPEPR